MQDTVESLYHSSLKLTGVNYYDVTNNMAALIRRSNNSYFENLYQLLHQNNRNAPVTPIDRMITQYAYFAFQAFTDPKENPKFLAGLNVVTTRLTELKNPNNRASIFANLESLDSAIKSAHIYKPLSKGQRALNISLLIAFAVLTALCIVAASAFPFSIGIIVAANILGLTSGIFFGYMLVKQITRQPTIFNSKHEPALQAAKDTGEKIQVRDTTPAAI